MIDIISSNVTIYNTWEVHAWWKSEEHLKVRQVKMHYHQHLYIYMLRGPRKHLHLGFVFYGVENPPTYAGLGGPHCTALLRWFLCQKWQKTACHTKSPQSVRIGPSYHTCSEMGSSTNTMHGVTLLHVDPKKHGFCDLENFNHLQNRNFSTLISISPTICKHQLQVILPCIGSFSLGVEDDMENVKAVLWCFHIFTQSSLSLCQSPLVLQWQVCTVSAHQWCKGQPNWYKRCWNMPGWKVQKCTFCVALCCSIRTCNRPTCTSAHLDHMSIASDRAMKAEALKELWKIWWAQYFLRVTFLYVVINSFDANSFAIWQHQVAWLCIGGAAVRHDGRDRGNFCVQIGLL